MSIPFLVSAEVTSPVLAINEDAATAKITVQALRGNVSVLMGSGGNIGVLSEPEGKLLVDAGIAVSKPRLKAALDGISPLPPKFLINTHWHWDHTDGNEWVHGEGATIIAHENVLKRLMDRTRVIEWGYTFPPVAPGAMPTVTYTKQKTIKFADETVVLTNHGSGHSDGDTIVYFKKADVLQLGDIFWNGHYPFIDYGAGGSIDGMIRLANVGLKQGTENTIIIPGHGPVGDRTQLREYRDMLVAIRRNISTLKKQGKSLAEIVAQKPTAKFDAKYGDYVIDPAFFILLVYTGV
ncbi:MBL fold metallo-hydrolase [Variovorax sp. J22P168]|uniref:MBL fold metallo-hydrolase n=1 Tax=Variovorax jilinensis TaxID=3053513 RepID=UPI002577088B|nr:MBL fold metallo-hydrolase [Variovorax sp. J22P168]MDM0015065.1 MBL fold metallo-hydrolase [Variovorax sp. J22P168]